jgi:hypothetical protein
VPDPDDLQWRDRARLDGDASVVNGDSVRTP